METRVLPHHSHRLLVVLYLNIPAVLRDIPHNGIFSVLAKPLYGIPCLVVLHVPKLYLKVLVSYNFESDCWLEVVWVNEVPLSRPRIAARAILVDVPVDFSQRSITDRKSTKVDLLIGGSTLVEILIVEGLAVARVLALASFLTSSSRHF